MSGCRSFDAALGHVERWAREGVLVPAQPRVALDASEDLARDEYGNARGGIRVPELDVPTGTHVGPYPASRLTGHTEPSPPERPRALHPDHADRVARVSRAALGRARR
ncbi:alpha/beta hydrolase domain-containing protein [Streptomyces sp. NPDC007088]|uniref:alpha/beta hydrolase domain-containing protein n=1 Tax=Streptomyces sp. NPDC007088 TaxID=3364773 RepID=UPI0036739B44